MDHLLPMPSAAAVFARNTRSTFVMCNTARFLFGNYTTTPRDEDHNTRSYKMTPSPDDTELVGSGAQEPPGCKMVMLVGIV